MKKYLPCIVAGIFIGTSYIPFPPWATLFCFVPLWLFWLRHQSANWKTIFIGGWITQFVLTIIGFNWVALTAHEFGLMPWPLAIVVLFLFCATANLDVPLAGLAWYFSSKRFQLNPQQKILTMALWTAIFESWTPTIFPWNYGYTWLWVNAPIAQTAELIGFQGLSSLIILMNLGVLAWWQQRKVRPLAITIGIFAVLNISGLIIKNTLPANDQEARVLITQANIGNMQKQAAEVGESFREHIFERYSNLTRTAITANPNTPVDFIVWPETAYPYDIDQRRWSAPNTNANSDFLEARYPFAARRLLQFTQEMNASLITGGYGYSPYDNKVTNTFFIFEKSGLIQPNPYFKTILLAFGEYIPGAQYFPEIKKWIPAGDFSRGPGPQMKSLKTQAELELKIGPQICYESLFPYFTKKLADQGAEMIVNLTNDSWYGTWQEPHQHLYMTLARAIEFRRPLVRATNTGISTVILASGQILETSPMNREWTYLYTIPYKTAPGATFYQICPWLIDALLIFSLFLLTGRSLVGSFKKSRLA